MGLMHLTRFTDYGLRTLIYLAVQDSGKRVTISEITEAYDLSRDHVVKVVHKLGQLGYIETVRGKGGGFSLGMKPDAINIGNVIEDLEPSLDVVDCENPVCRISPGCRLKGILHDATKAFMGVLGDYTLADLVKRRQQTRDLLGIESD